MPKRVTDRFEMHIDGGCACATRHSCQLATQRCTYKSAHFLSGEFRLGEEIAELCQRALPNERSFSIVVASSRSARAIKRRTYLGRHIATWDYTRLEKRATRLVGVGDRAFRTLGNGDDDHAALTCFAESRHQVFTLRRISRAECFEDHPSNGRREKGLDCGGGNAWKEA